LYRLGDETGPNARHATHAEFKAFITSIVGFGPGVDVSRWIVTRRRDVLNFCLSQNILEAVDGVIRRPIKNQSEKLDSTEQV
jgi:hypothetical protein